MTDQADDNCAEVHGRAYADPHGVEPLPLFMPLTEADLRRVRAFWRGVLMGATLAALAAWWLA